MINIRVDGLGKKRRFPKKIFKLTRLFSKLLRYQLTINANDKDFIFFPQNAIEYYRYMTFFTKEEGTIAWLKNNVRDGDVFFDIGANIGIYSLYAAKLGKNVKTYAFEPHKFTFVKLMDNIAVNNLQQQIFPISLPLDETCGITKLNYASVDSGSSMSQVGHNMHPENGAFTPKLEEIVYCVTLDKLIEENVIPCPQHIKIDVDGNELRIIRGMAKLLASPKKPKTIQIEVNPGQKSEVTQFMNKHDFRLDHSHYTADGKIKKDKGQSEDEIAHNVVFIS